MFLFLVEPFDLLSLLLNRLLCTVCVQAKASVRNRSFCSLQPCGNQFIGLEVIFYLTKQIVAVALLKPKDDGTRWYEKMKALKGFAILYVFFKSQFSKMKNCELSSKRFFPLNLCFFPLNSCFFVVAKLDDIIE